MPNTTVRTPTTKTEAISLDTQFTGAVTGIQNQDAAASGTPTAATVNSAAHTAVLTTVRNDYGGFGLFAAAKASTLDSGPALPSPVPTGWIFVFLVPSGGSSATPRMIVRARSSTTVTSSDLLRRQWVISDTASGQAESQPTTAFQDFPYQDPALADLASLTDAAFEARITSLRQTGLTSWTNYLDTITVTVSWQLHGFVNGTISGVGILSGTRRLDAHTAKGAISLLLATGSLSGKRQAERILARGAISFPIGTARLSATRGAESRETGTIAVGSTFLSGRRQADLRRAGTMAATAVLAGARAVQRAATGAISGSGILSVARRAEVARTTQIQATGNLSGIRGSEQKRSGAILGIARISGTRQADARRTTSISSLGILAGSRQAERNATGVLAAIIALSGGRTAARDSAGTITAIGRISGGRQAQTSRLGALLSVADLAAQRQAEARRAAPIAGLGILSGSRRAEALRSTLLASVSVLSGSRRTETSRTGLIESEALLSAARQAERGLAGALLGEVLLQGSYLLHAGREGALSVDQDPWGSRLKGWGVVYSFGISGTTWNEDGSDVVDGVTVDLFRSDNDQKLQTQTSDTNGFFTFAVSSDPIPYYLVGHKDDGTPDGEHLIDTTDQELLAEVTQVQGPSAPTDD